MREQLIVVERWRRAPKAEHFDVFDHCDFGFGCPDSLAAHPGTGVLLPTQFVRIAGGRQRKPVERSRLRTQLIVVPTWPVRDVYAHDRVMAWLMDELSALEAAYQRDLRRIQAGYRSELRADPRGMAAAKAHRELTARRARPFDHRPAGLVAEARRRFTEMVQPERPAVAR